jgi:hypothetical protein
VLGNWACLAVAELGMTGQLPEPGSPAFGQFIEMAAVGDVEIATVILIKDHEWVPADGMVGEKLRQAPAPETPAAPISLQDELTAMGLIGSTTPPPASVPMP